jgi:hypothetical protein
MVTRRRHLVLIQGGKAEHLATVRRLYPYEKRVVRAEPRPDPTPPRTAA